jgi:hypothetical protein
MRIFATAATLAALLLVGTSAQQPPKPADATAEDISIHRYGDSDKTCQEWTDGCRTCRRADAGDPVCPNIGIACQPKAVTCERRAEEKK